MKKEEVIIIDEETYQRKKQDLGKQNDYFSLEELENFNTMFKIISRD